MSNLSKAIAGVLLVAGLVLAVIAWRLVAQAPHSPVATLVDGAESAAKSESVLYPVVVAIAKIESGTRLDSGMLKLEQWPVPIAAGYRQVTALDGEMTRLSIGAGEPVTREMLAQGMQKQLLAGERALTIAIDEISGAASRIMPGDLVDIFFMLDKGAEVPFGQARLLQSRVRVLADGAQSLDGTPSEEDKAAAQPHSAAAAPARTAILAVPVDQVNELLLASRAGHLQLVLRSVDDSETVDTDLFTPRSVVLQARSGLDKEQREQLKSGANRAYAGDSLVQLSGPDASSNLAQPHAAGGRGRSVEIIRGNQAQSMSF